jgi:hypothetical protein
MDRRNRHDRTSSPESKTHPFTDSHEMTLIGQIGKSGKWDIGGIGRSTPELNWLSPYFSGLG